MTDKDIGNLRISHPEPLIAGRLVTVVFEYTVGERGLHEGGKLRIGLPHVGWASPEVPQYYFWSEYVKGKGRRYTAYDRVNTTARLETRSAAVAFLETEGRHRKPWKFPASWLRDYDRFWITVTVEDADLAPGDKVIVTYGDPEQLPLTARVQSFPERKICFLAFVDAKGDGRFEEVPGSPCITGVRAGPCSRIDVIAPAIVRPGGTPLVRVAYTDAVHARPEPTPHVTHLGMRVADQDTQERTAHIDRATDSVTLEAPELLQPRERGQCVRVRVRDAEAKTEATGNPALLRNDGLKLFFGDLHGHSQYHHWNAEEGVGASCGTPEECYRYARDIAGLDFCAISDTGSIAKDVWEATVAATLRANEPHRFLAFQGSEVGDIVNGHRNLIFGRDDAEPRVRTKRTDEWPSGGVEEELQTRQVQKRYERREDVLLIPHHTKMWLNWDCYLPELEPVMEIYSIWGSGEKSGTDMWTLREVTGGAQEAWARGYRIGVIAGSDTHTGLPGRSLAKSDRDDFMVFKGGHAAVWAEALTRGAVFEALKARRCYATTGARIILETFIEEYPMGSDVAWPDKAQPRRLCIGVWGTDDLLSVTVVKNNVDVHVFKPSAGEAQFMWEDRQEANAGDYYYVRVIQRDGNRAWASPIWLDL